LSLRSPSTIAAYYPYEPPAPPYIEAHIRSLRSVTAQNFDQCINHPDVDPNGNIFT
jgi:hypothetical protein